MLYLNRFRGKPAIPSLIGLSPLATIHPSILQHTRVRPSNKFSVWSWLDHLDSGHIMLTFESLFLAFTTPTFNNLSSLALYTRWPIIQKVYWHHLIIIDSNGFRRLLVLKFNFYFTPLPTDLFTRSDSLTVLLCAIGYLGVFRLSRWIYFIQIMNHISQSTLINTMEVIEYRPFTYYGVPFQDTSSITVHSNFSLFRIRSPLLPKSNFISTQIATQMFHFAILSEK